MTNKVAIQKDVVEQVLSKIDQLMDIGGINLPKDYSPANAIQAAGLILADTLDKNKKPALEVCTKASIANSLFKMAIQGLNPIKNQCYFIVYGNQLSCQRSYEGSILLAKRYSGVKDIRAQVIYEGDEFEYKLDLATGLMSIVKHEVNIKNIDKTKIVGAYASVIREDGLIDVHIMPFEEIKASWLMRKGNGLTQAHKDFTDEMARKTVINRSCKHYINSSTDNIVIDDTEEQESLKPSKPKKDERISLVEAEVEEVKQEQKEENQPTTDFNDNSDLQGNPGF